MSVSTQQSQSRQLAIHGMWVLPLLCGVVAFGWARLGQAGSRAVLANTTARARNSQPMRQDVDVAFLEAQRSQNTIPDGQPYPSVDQIDTAALKAFLLRMKTQEISESRSRFIALCDQGAGALVKKEGAAGLQWIGDNLPVLYQDAMDQWAGIDPDAAFEVIVSNQRFNPCSPEILTMLLQRHAEKGPEALAIAAERVPWQLFLSDKGQPNALSFEKDADVRPWVESGVLPHLAEQHIGMEDFFTAWSEQDPSGAIAGWKNWPDDDGRGVDRGLKEILVATSRSEEKANQIDQAISGSDAATSARFVGVTKRLIENDPFHDFYEIVEKFPHLRDLAEPPEPTETEDHEDE